MVILESTIALTADLQSLPLQCIIIWSNLQFCDMKIFMAEAQWVMVNCIHFSINFFFLKLFLKREYFCISCDTANFYPGHIFHFALIFSYFSFNKTLFQSPRIGLHKNWKQTSAGLLYVLLAGSHHYYNLWLSTLSVSIFLGGNRKKRYSGRNYQFLSFDRNR